MIVEVCASSLKSALIAQSAGVDRLELCTALGVGGLTPSYGLLKSVKEHIDIPVHVLIRPRMGDFTYNDYEFQMMLDDIEIVKSMGFEGVVSGVLNQDFTIDINRTKELINAASGMTFAFHRAFDWVPNPEQSLKELEVLGVAIVLSSGQKSKAIDGISLLERLQLQTNSMVIMPGSGVNDSTVTQFEQTGFKAVHLSGVVAEHKIDLTNKIAMSSPPMLLDDHSYETSSMVLQRVQKALGKS